MSRIGKKPIEIPNGVDVGIDGSNIKVKGKNGELSRVLHHTMDVKMEGKVITVLPKEAGKHSNFQGLTRTLIANMIEGCGNGYTKSLSLVGVGYRASLAGKSLNLTLGFSHPIAMEPLPGIEFAVEKQTTIHVKGASKENVGEMAAKIRSLRPPEPYHGKGVRYLGEHIATKVGKAAGKK